MQIGVDATCWQNTRGYGRHARALLSNLVALDTHNHYTFFMDSAENLESLPSGAAVQMVQAASPTVIAASSKSRRSLADMWRMSRAMSDGDFDLLLFPTVYSYVPIFSRARKIIMIHDVIAETYPQLTLPSATAKLFWKMKVKLGRLQADAIVTVSDYSRQGIVKHLKVLPERVFVVSEASDPCFQVLKKPTPTPYLERLGITGDCRTVLYVGGFNPHKNLQMLVSVFAKLVSEQAFSDLRLVMVGEYKKEAFHSYFETIKNQVEELGIEERVVFTGFLPDEELVVLLNLSTVLVLPSLIEGFGLPAVEAAACGCPVIATTASPLPNLLGKGALYFDPTDADQLEVTLRSLFESEQLRQQTGEAGLAAAKQLTWKASALQMMELIQKVAR
jgi:glycosyltransferase involved in cell wall biosynthesis